MDLESQTEEEVILSIYDLPGRKIYEEKQRIEKGHNQTRLEVDRWEARMHQLIFRLHSPSQGSHQRQLIKGE